MQPRPALVLVAASLLMLPLAPTQPAAIALDGYRDAAYVLVAEDAPNDLPPPYASQASRKWADVTRLFTAHDADNFYVYAELPQYDPAHASGEIGLAFVLPAGASAGARADPLTPNLIHYAYTETSEALCAPVALGATRHPDVLIRGLILGMDDGYNVSNGFTLRATSAAADWENATVDWGGIGSSVVEDRLAYGVGAGVEFSIPWADLGLTGPDDLAGLQLSFFTTAKGINVPGILDVVPPDPPATAALTSTVLSRLQSLPWPLPAPASVAFGCGTATVSEATSPAQLTVQLNSVLSQTVAVSYSTTALTAGEADFTPTTGTATFVPGTTRLTLALPIANDTLDETDETFRVTLSNPQGVTLAGPVTATITIVDDDEGGPAYLLFAPFMQGGP